MIYQAKSYIRFLRLSKNKHGVHSPFVYNLTTQCFNDKTRYKAYTVFKKHRKALGKDQTAIEIKDFGEGSRIFKGNARKVSEILKVAGLRKKRQRLLYRITKYLGCKDILELGTSLGLGSVALALSDRRNTIHTVEGCPNTLKKAEEYFKKCDILNVETHQELFSEYLSKLTTETFDLVFIDGDHNGERTYHYFESLLQHVHNDTLLIFDDIYWSQHMTKAWNNIIAHPKVTVSIDTFHWGLVFFRKEQQKQHFIIRV